MAKDLCGLRQEKKQKVKTINCPRPFRVFVQSRQTGSFESLERGNLPILTEQDNREGKYCHVLPVIFVQINKHL